MEIIKPGEPRTLKSIHPYPSEAVLLSGRGSYQVPAMSTAFGYVLKGECRVGGREVFPKEFFSAPTSDAPVEVTAAGDALVAIFVRHGFLGQQLIGKVEAQGRVSYIDGCTDSVLVCPPRLGDPCLNSLHFPAGVDQTFHTHQSVRLGVVAQGSGVSSVKPNPGAEAEEVPLKYGYLFMLIPHELHRFRTTNGEPMTVIAYHPDSDWGPTDQTHPMINRTYFDKR